VRRWFDIGIIAAIGRDYLLASVLFLSLSLYFQLNHSEDQLLQRSLQDQAMSVADQLTFDAHGKLESRAAVALGYRCVVYDATGEVLMRIPEAAIPAVVAEPLRREALRATSVQPGTLRYFATGPGDAPSALVGAVLRTSVSGRPVDIQFYRDQRERNIPVNGVVRTYTERLAWGFIPTLCALIVANMLLAYRRLRPVEDAAAMARVIGPGSLDRRLPEINMPSDILPLIKSVNAAFDRVDRAFRAQHEFLTNAAHELRTPMAMLSARVSSIDDPELSSGLREDIRALARIVSQLLQLSELDMLTAGGAEQTELGDIVLGVTEALEREARRAGKILRASIPDDPICVVGDPDVIEIATRNLVENAIEHTREGELIEVRLDHTGTLEVADKGPGIADAIRDKIFTPFWRGSSSGQGAGLGLAIVQRIADLYAAQISVANAPGGGARFTLRFKPAPCSATAASGLSVSAGGKLSAASPPVGARRAS
jgi:signal transduction histidine kinase